MTWLVCLDSWDRHLCIIYHWAFGVICNFIAWWMWLYSIYVVKVPIHTTWEYIFIYLVPYPLPKNAQLIVGEWEGWSDGGLMENILISLFSTDVVYSLKGTSATKPMSISIAVDVMNAAWSLNVLPSVTYYAYQNSVERNERH